MTQNTQKKLDWLRLGLGSFLLSANLLVGRIIQNKTQIYVAGKLSLYAATYFFFRKIVETSENSLIQAQFEYAKKNVCDQDELRRMERAWKIKNVALEQDKKDLVKYKLDTQSYH